MWDYNFMQSIKTQNAVKALLLIALALFLYTRLANGTLYFYINERFVGFTLIAVFGLLAVGLSYRIGRQNTPAVDVHAHEHETAAHDHPHSHALSWGGALIVLLPIALGLLVRPQPLGAAALSNREINSGANSLEMPAVARAIEEKAPAAKNLLDWWQTLRTSANPAQELAGQTVNVTGFVYHDERFGNDAFMVTRYVVSCCVADASPLGLVVDWPQAPEFKDDQWIEVKGTFAPSTIEAWHLPVLVAESVTPITAPNQPYLYP